MHFLFNPLLFLLIYCCVMKSTLVRSFFSCVVLLLVFLSNPATAAPADTTCNISVHYSLCGFFALSATGAARPRGFNHTYISSLTNTQQRRWDNDVIWRSTPSSCLHSLSSLFVCGRSTETPWAGNAWEWLVLHVTRSKKSIVGIPEWPLWVQPTWDLPIQSLTDWPGLTTHYMIDLCFSAMSFINSRL